MVVGLVAGAFECNQTIFNGSRSFALTQAILDDVSGDIQQVVDCVGPQESIVVDAGLTVRFASTARFTSGVIFKSGEVGENRPVLKCPQGMPLIEVRYFDGCYSFVWDRSSNCYPSIYINKFLIQWIVLYRSAGVVLQNFIVSGCDLAMRDSSALLVDVPTVQSEEHEENPNVLIDNVEFVHNENVDGPGAIYLKAAASVALVNVTFINNVGRDGGAVGLHADGSRILFDQCAFLENSALDSGGAVFQNASANLTILDAHFLLNQARLIGGAVFLRASPVCCALYHLVTLLSGRKKFREKCSDWLICLFTGCPAAQQC